MHRGDAFFALSGGHRDGAEFVAEALAHGAVAVITPGPATLEPVSEAATRVWATDPRLALAQAAASFHGHPSRRLKVVGVTGTNGKTTTTWLTESILRAARIPAGVLGTTGYRFGDEVRPAPFTTPQAPELQALLREMVELGLEAVALEVSSHALEQRRSFGLEVDVAVFLNLSHDHLDYHGTLERYLDAKLMLFDGRNAPHSGKRATAVVNADDATFPMVRAAAARGGLATLGYGAAPEADLRLEAIAATARGLEFRLHDRGAMVAIELPLLGHYNAWNAAAAYGAARVLGIAPEVAVRGLALAPAVPGRLERIDRGQAFMVVVDYAHTPDALARALETMRAHVPGRVLVVFGCGGDRDRAKRPVMGRIAAAGADLGWITNDNPRTEEPASIAREIASGDPAGRLVTELDREAVIGLALAAARAGDGVLIAGKGHETTQTIGARVLPFDDRDVVRSGLDRLGGRR